MWPKRSFTVLKSSMSRIRSATPGPPGARALDRLLDPLLEQRPVRKAGEGIVERLVTQALLRLALLRDVEQVPLERDGDAGRPEDRPGLVVDPDDAPVPCDQPVLEGEPVAFVRATMRVEDGLAVLRVEDPHEELAITLPLVERVSEHRLDLRAGVDVRALVVDRVDVDDERQLLDERPETLLRRADPLLARPEDGVRACVTAAPPDARREGRREADAGIGCVGRHAVRIVAAQGDGRPLVRGTPYGASPLRRPARPAAPRSTPERRRRGT